MSVNSRQFFVVGSLFSLCGIALGVQQQAVRPATAGQQPAATLARATISGLVTRAGTGEPVRKAFVTLLPGGGGQGGNRAQGGAGQLPPQPGQPVPPGNNPQAQGGQGQQAQAQQARGQRGQAQQGGRQGGGGGGAVSVNSGDDGTFTFTDIPAGTYRIRVDRDGYLSQEYGQRSWTGSGIPVTVQPGQTLHSLTFQLIQGGTIAGRIVDENLEPVAGLQVEALSYVYQNGTRTLISERQVTTNDLGEYRLYWLTPGDHYVSAIPSSRRGGLVQAPQNFAQRGGRGAGQPFNVQDAPEEAYAPMFYPGSIDPENAAPVRVTAASEMRGIDFVLRPTRMAKISGRVIGATITPTAQQLQQQAQQQGRGNNRGQNGGGRGGQGNIQVVLTRVGAAAGGRGQGGGGRGGGRLGIPGVQSLAQVNPADGSFEIANVVPGTYNLIALQQAQNQVYSARMRVDVGPADIGGISLAVRPGVEIPGQIYVEGTPPANFRMNGLRVALTSLDNLPFGNTNAQVDATGKFTLANIPTMTYRINVQGMPAGSYLIAGRFGSTDALAEPLSVDQTGTLSLQLGFSPGQVSGEVTDSAGRPVPAAITVLIPTARGRTDLYKTTNSDANGRVNFTNVAPGDYKVIAWEDVPQGAYLNADFVAPYEDRAQSVHVDRNTSPSFQVRVIPRNEQ
jgi:hypothetical protein